MTRPAAPYVPKRRYKKRGPHTWAAVKEAFLAGVTAAECAERFDVTVHALYWRARQGGWRKMDESELHDLALQRSEADARHAAAAAPPRPDSDDPAALAAEALALSVQAMRAGRASEAHALARLAEVAARLPRLAAPPRPETPTDAEARRAAEQAAERAAQEQLEARAFEYARYMLTGGSLSGAGAHGYWPEFVLDGDRIIRTASLPRRPQPVDEAPITAAIHPPQPRDVPPFRLKRGAPPV